MKNYHKIIIVGYIDDLIRRFNTFVRNDNRIEIINTDFRESRFSRDGEEVLVIFSREKERERGLYNDN